MTSRKPIHEIIIASPKTLAESRVEWEGVGYRKRPKTAPRPSVGRFRVAFGKRPNSEVK